MVYRQMRNNIHFSPRFSRGHTCSLHNCLSVSIRQSVAYFISPICQGILTPPPLSNDLPCSSRQGLSSLSSVHVFLYWAPHVHVTWYILITFFMVIISKSTLELVFKFLHNFPIWIKRRVKLQWEYDLSIWLIRLFSGHLCGNEWKYMKQ